MRGVNQVVNKRTRSAGVLALLALLLLSACFQPVDRLEFANRGVELTLEPPSPTATPAVLTTPTPTDTPQPDPTEVPISTPIPEVDLFVQILEPAGGITVLGRNLTVRGITNIGNSISVNGRSLDVNDEGGFTTEMSLSVGVNVVEVLATNIRGEQIREFATVSYIRPTPSIFSLLVTEPADQIVVADQIIRVSGKTIPQATVTVNGVGVRVDEDGNFTTLVRMRVGSNTIEVLARNADGRSLPAKRTVTYSP